MTIYICTPVGSRERSPELVRLRVEELASRLKAKGFDSVSHLDCPTEDGRWSRKVGGNISLLLDSDGILLDCTRKSSRVCVIEESVAKVITSWKPHFLFLHTREEYDRINDNYVV